MRAIRKYLCLLIAAAMLAVGASAAAQTPSQFPAALNYTNPINRTNPLGNKIAQGSWYKMLPLSPRGLTWVDLCRRVNGTLTSAPIWQTRAHPNGYGSLLFSSASTQYVDLGSTARLAANVPFTICWWENIVAATNTFPSRVSFDRGSSQCWLVVRSDNAGYNSIAMGPTNTNPVVKCTTVATIANSLGVWKHLAIVCTVGPNSSTPGDYTVYENGVANSCVAAQSYGSLSNRNRIGYDGGDNGTDAYIDDVMLFPSVALSAADLRSIFQATQQYPCPLLNYGDDEAAWQTFVASTIFRRSLNNRAGSRSATAVEPAKPAERKTLNEVFPLLNLPDVPLEMLERN